MNAHRRRSACRLAALWLVAGCSGHGLRVAPEPRGDVDRERREIERASARLDSLGRAGAVTALADLFGDSGRLTGPNRAAPDAVGAAAIADRLTADSGQTGGATIATFQRRTIENCRDGGAVESGRYSLEQRGPDATSRVVAGGPYRVRWRLDAGGVGFIQELALGGYADRDVASGSRCSSTRGLVYVQRRLFLTGTIPPLSASSWRTAGEMHRTLAARGWSSSVDIPVPGRIDAARTVGSRWSSPFEVSARVRIVGSLSIEAYGQATEVTGFQTGWNRAESSYVVQTFAARDGGLLVSYDWRGLRTAVGPSLVRVDWQNSHDRIDPAPNGDYVYWSATKYQMETATVAGVAGQIAYDFPLSEHTFVELGARARHCSAAIPALGRYPAWNADLSGRMAALAFGIAF